MKLLMARFMSLDSASNSLTVTNSFSASKSPRLTPSPWICCSRENLLLKLDHRTDLAISLLEIGQRGAGLFKRPAFRLKVAVFIGLIGLIDGEPGQLAKGLNLLDEGIEQIRGNADRKLQGSISIETLTLFVLYQRIVLADQTADAGLLLFKLGGSQPDIRDLFVLLIGAGSDGRDLNRNRAFALVRCVVFDALAELPARSVEGIAPMQDHRFICFAPEPATEAE